MGLGNILNLNRIRRFYDHFRKGVDNPALLNDIQWWYRLIELALAITEVKEILNMLKGYKTYLVAALTAALTFAHSMGYIDTTTYQALLALLGAGGLASVAAKINRVQDELDYRIKK